MVAISIFSPGINYSYIRVVFYISAPVSIIDFVQEVGQVERDNKGGISCIFLLKKWKVVDIGLVGKLLLDKTKVMQRYLNNPRYWLLLLSIFLNRVQQIYKGKSRLCNRYRELGILVGAKLVVASKLREGNIGMLEGWDEYLSSSSAEDLKVGSWLLKQHVRD